MLRISVMERKNEGIAEAIRRHVPENCRVSEASAGAEELSCDIFVLSNHAAEEARLSNVKCHAALLPGDGADKLPAVDGCVISYGLAPKCSLTASSLGEDEPLLAVQRELPRPDGGTVEQQELRVRRLAGLGDSQLLAAAGALLLCGVTPWNKRDKTGIYSHQKNQ